MNFDLLQWLTEYLSKYFHRSVAPVVKFKKFLLADKCMNSYLAICKIAVLLCVTLSIVSKRKLHILAIITIIGNIKHK